MLKSGVVLCNLLRTLQPDIIMARAPSPKRRRIIGKQPALLFRTEPAEAKAYADDEDAAPPA